MVFDSEFVLADCMVVRSERELGVMTAEVLDAARGYPVVCLTSRAGEVDPALSPAAVREVVGPGIPLYFVGGMKLQMLLAERLPERLEVYRGAVRVWWPGVSEQSDPEDHPLIFNPVGADEAQSLEKLAYEFRLERGPVDLTAEQRAVVAERQLKGERRRNDYLEKSSVSTSESSQKCGFGMPSAVSRRRTAGSIRDIEVQGCQRNQSPPRG